MKDYILVHGRNIPVEQDVIYSAESVVELFNDGFTLVSDEQFIEYNTSTNLIIEPATLATPDPECCEHCNLFDVFSKGLCQGCFEDQYSDGARW